MFSLQMTVDTDLLLNTAVVLAVLIPALFLWSQKVRQSKIWQAMTTPLASIIGSGFLVLVGDGDALRGRVWLRRNHPLQHFNV
jgi:hypothetical protein